MARFVKFEMRGGGLIWINPELVATVYLPMNGDYDCTVIESAGVTTNVVVKGAPADVADLLSSEGGASAARPAQGTGELSPERLAEFKAWLAGVWRNIAEGKS